MIYTISGIITHISDQKVVVAQSGIGFELTCANPAQFSINQSVTLYTYLHWSQELGPSLFGFVQSIEKELFILIISCSGIGPKLGITILANTTPEALLTMICQENTASLSAIKGLGSKKAEQLVISLKDKASKMLGKIPTANLGADVNAWLDLTQTLTSLNYSNQEIKLATQELKNQIPGQTLPFDLLLRKALTLLAKK